MHLETCPGCGGLGVVAQPDPQELQGGGAGAGGGGLSRGISEGSRNTSDLGTGRDQGLIEKIGSLLLAIMAPGSGGLGGVAADKLGQKFK